jgi:hypothetical protein
MASKNTEIRMEEVEKMKKEKQERTKAYLEDIRAVDEKHRMAFHPIIRTLEDGSIVPRMVVVDLVETNEKK